MIPYIEEVKPLRHISYTQYKMLGVCLLKSLPNNSVCICGEIQAEDINNKPQIVGKIFHDLLCKSVLDDSNKLLGQNLRNLHDEIIHAYQKRLEYKKSDLAKSIIFWPELEKIFFSVSEYNDTSDKVCREYKLYSNDGVIKGIIDEVIFRGDEVILIEYKSKNTEEELKKDEYLDQIHTYSGLYYEYKNCWPNKLIIRGITGVKNEINIDQFYSIRLLSKLRNRFIEINSKINKAKDIFELCTPRRDLCNLCKRNIVCPAILKRGRVTLSENNEIAKLVIKQVGDKGCIVLGKGGCIKKGREVNLHMNGSIMGSLSIGDEVLVNHVYVKDDGNHLYLTDKSNIYHE